MKSSFALVPALYARLLDLLGILAGLLFLFLAVAVTVDVVVRNLGWGTLEWMLEAAQYGMFAATFLAAPWVLRLASHVRVDVVIRVVPARTAAWMEGIVDTIGIALCVALFSYGLDATIDAAASKMTRGDQFQIPDWTLLSIIPLVSVLLGIEFGLRLRRVLRGEPADTQDVQVGL